jgi:hypothetical protein
VLAGVKMHVSGRETRKRVDTQQNIHPLPLHHGVVKRITRDEAPHLITIVPKIPSWHVVSLAWKGYRLDPTCKATETRSKYTTDR